MTDADTPLFSGLKQRMAWLSQRQKVLAANIANADTPGYRPRDLRPQSFESLVDAARSRIVPAITDPQHLRGAATADGAPRASEQRQTFETAPAGNAVVIEEQMAKVNETTLSHRLTSELYRKHIGLLKLAIGRGR